LAPINQDLPRQEGSVFGIRFSIVIASTCKVRGNLLPHREIASVDKVSLAMTEGEECLAMAW
jgi:hypothetical protein